MTKFTKEKQLRVQKLLDALVAELKDIGPEFSLVSTEFDADDEYVASWDFNIVRTPA